MKNIFKFGAILFIFFSFYACVEDGDFTIPTLGYDKEYATIKPLTEIADLYQGSLVDFEEDITTFGYVVSNDKEGNFYKSIIIQDSPENPSIGFEVLIDDFNLNARYTVGRKIFIKLKGLFLNRKNGAYQIGAENTFRNGVTQIGPNDYVYFIDRSSEIATVIPTELKTTQLTDAHINTLIKINNLQSETQGLTYANSSNTDPVDRIFTSCDSFETITLTTSGFADFKALPIPNKKGSITAILNKLENDYQLFIRGTNDVDLTEEYGCYQNPTETSLTDIKALFTESETTITQNSKIKVIVTSDLSKGNISNQNVFAQDNLAGISLNFSDTHNLNLGDEIEIAVGGLKLNENNGLLQLNLAASNILNTTTGTLPAPEIVSLSQALSGDYESKLVQIEDVQFKDITKVYVGANTLTSDCANELKILPVKPEATFANNQVSDKKGTITGVMTQANGIYLYIRGETDVYFTETYACSPTGGGGSGNDLFFSEYAEGSSNNKYIEIYNGTGVSVDLSTYKIELYGNGSVTATRNLALSTLPNTTLANGEILVIYNASANDVIKNEGDFASGVIFFNGDDAIALLKNDMIIDVVGKIGEDPGVGWEVAGTTEATKDHTLIRKSAIIKGNTDWTVSVGTNTSNSEWEVKDKDDFSSVGNR
ncbi:lamin tail domain-containing protein [Tenacibaculum sp. AHE15PA]|uniref:DUF5689 domain-containing protein n=1 Tax=unclassified Tenacibaculum TaxID=2635139 RepID=UPI001C4FC008|nr:MULTISPECIES: DUF5689 domain-containing protein [unclassified Tenacibaculum]QXP72948.1 lamin tail domain-containing protein [Tenacibaculum sp. AHE14PA]QXP76862.1 lamin tail domain-containing protein [Tenacibaculum sp. AHE15PA]